MIAAVGAVKNDAVTLRLDDLAPGEVRPLTTSERERLAATRGTR